MNKINKVQLVLVVLFGLTFLFPLISSAQQIPDPGCDPADPLCPIDGGLSILIATGIGLGARKLVKRK
jgi:hypothetical protein